MKRLLSSLLFASMLIVGAGQAQASPLTDFTFEITNFEFSQGEVFEWNGVDSTGVVQTVTKNGDIVGTDTEATNIFTGFTHKIDLFDGNPQGSNSPFENQETISTLSFSYEVTSASTGISMSKDVTMKLNYYADGKGNEYVYYTTMASTSDSVTSYGDWAYSLVSPFFFIDGRDMVKDPVSGLYGWTINNDTINNLYDEIYYVGDGTTNLKGPKDIAGLFEIGLSFAVYADDPKPEPTPEPATMLLMGAGLAGLGFVKRRRQA